MNYFDTGSFGMERRAQMHCSLCHSDGPFQILAHLAWKERRKFALCPICDAVFVPSDELVTRSQEKERYETHQNDLSSPGFAEFLQKTVDVVQKNIPAGSRVLDFGSGPEPSMARLLEQAGYDVAIYDPFFAPSKVERLFDLILVHEVFEHLRQPQFELDQIKAWLKPEGIFLIRSELRPEPEAFTRWWYARDYTHILFCSRKTLDWIAQHNACELKMWSPVHWAFHRAPCEGVGEDEDENENEDNQ